MILMCQYCVAGAENQRSTSNEIFNIFNAALLHECIYVIMK